MSSVNKVILVGNLGGDPESIASGKGCTFSLATNAKWKDKKGQLQEKTEWHRVKVWGKAADPCMKYLTKGRQVYVEGRIESGEYTDKDGNERRSFDIVAYDVTFLSGESSAPSGGGGRKKKKRRRKKAAPAASDDDWGDDEWEDDDDWGGADQPFDDDDIPF